MSTGILHTHTLIVVLYLLQLLVKVFFLVTKKHEQLDKFSEKTKVPHIILASLMVVTGGALLFFIGAEKAFSSYMIVKYVLVVASIPVGIIGMKKKNNIMGILSLLMLIYVFAIAKTKDLALRSQKAQTEALMEADTDSGADADLVKGKAIYTTRCQLCHGEDGKLGFQGAKNLTESSLSDEEMHSLIRNGKGVMPPLGAAEVPDEDVDKVIKYVRTLK